MSRSAERVSRSLLWDLLRDYYQQHGVAAWDEKVPYFVTNSQVIGDLYAEVAMGLIQDRPLQEPLCILELGAGTGRFAYNMVRSLLRKLEYFPHLRGKRVLYVLSDFVESTVRFWEQHRGMEEIAAHVDFALWSEQGPLQLRKAGTPLELGGAPLMVVANYFLDSLPYDEFRVQAGQLEEVLVEVHPKATRNHSNEHRLDVRDVHVDRVYRTVKDPQSYYEEPLFQGILMHYLEHIQNGTFTIPLGAHALLGRLRQWGPLVLLASDRGFTVPGNMASYAIHAPALHEGAFSHMVNFHALAFGFRQTRCTWRESLDGVQTICFSDLTEATPNLDYAFAERLQRGDLINASSDLFGHFNDRPGWKSLLAFVQLNQADPNALAVVGKRLLDYTQGLSPDDHRQLIRILEQAWQNDYHFPGAPNLTFWLGLLYNSLGYCQRGLFFLEETTRRKGDDPMLVYLRGCSMQALGRLEEARALYLQALDQAPGMPEATRALASIDG